MKKYFLFTLIILLLPGFGLRAQQRYTVGGTVADKTGAPLVGATVLEKGTGNGVVTGAKGEFTLQVANAGADIVISFLGYTTIEVKATDIKPSVAIVLQDDMTEIDDVVVIGYGTVRKSDLTGSVTAVKAEDINRGAVTSAQEMLMGKVPGVHILPGDGGPGTGSTIRIRGAASLKASNDPLIVIDGVPTSNDAAPGMANGLALLNPNDIESFTVLKDASATAIYGARASNGVIIITTKRGKGQKMQISYNSVYSVGVNSKTVPTMSADEYRAFMLDFYPEGTANGDVVRNLMGEASTDWQDEIFRPAFTTDQNLSIFGSYDTKRMTMPYRASVGFTSEDGTLHTANTKGVTADLSVSPEFFDNHLKVTLNAKGILNFNHYADGGAVNNAAFFDPTQSVHFMNADGSVDRTKANGWWSWLTPSGEANSLSNMNPMTLLYERQNTNKPKRFIGNAQFDYQLHWLPELRFNLNLGMDIASTAGVDGIMPGSVQAMRDSDYPGIGKYRDYTNFRSNHLLEFYMAYAKEIGRHRFDAMAGYSWQHFYTSDDSIQFQNETGTIFSDPPKSATENYLLSFFGRANYVFDSRYFFTFTLRNDASSRFSPDTRWGLFPSVAFAWSILDEPFMKDNTPLSTLKLRLGWGETGQQDLGLNDYPYMARYTLSTSPYVHYYLDGQYHSVLKPLAYDQNIKWETTTTYNVGLDYGFLKGRINGSLDFYFRKTKDLLNTVTVPIGSNLESVVTTNVGNMENKGVELAVGAVVIQQKDLTLNVGLNVTWQDTEITKLLANNDPDYYISTGNVSIGTGSDVQLHKVGYAPYSFYTFQQVYGSDGMPIQNAFVDQNGDGEITGADKYISGKKPAPDVFFGLNARLNYKNWDFGFNSHASFGNYVFNAYYAGNSTPVGDFLGQGFLVNLSKTVKDSGFKYKNTSNQAFTDLFLEDASFFRMDDITLGYTFDLKQENMKLRTAFCVQNAFVITGYSGMDPEGSGIDNNIWPRPRIFSLRLALNF